MTAQDVATGLLAHAASLNVMPPAIHAHADTSVRAAHSFFVRCPPRSSIPSCAPTSRRWFYRICCVMRWHESDIARRPLAPAMLAVLCTRLPRSWSRAASAKKTSLRQLKRHRISQTVCLLARQIAASRERWAMLSLAGRLPGRRTDRHLITGSARALPGNCRQVSC
jgi:hypothetical protein